jgi:hypothetical protein
MRDPRLERELFGEVKGEKNTGIDFAAYDKIPVEMTGEDCPEPNGEFEESVLGPEMMNTVKLSGYTKPTPVQKYEEERRRAFTSLCCTMLCKSVSLTMCTHNVHLGNDILRRPTLETRHRRTVRGNTATPQHRNTL